MSDFYLKMRLPHTALQQIMRDVACQTQRFAPDRLPGGNGGEAALASPRKPTAS
jgi:hypothetical protein